MVEASILANSPTEPDACAQAMRNWFDGKNSPGADNLVVLLQRSDQIRRTVLEPTDRRNLVLAVGLSRLRAQLGDLLTAINGAQSG